MPTEADQVPVPNQAQLQEMSNKLKTISTQTQELSMISQQLQDMSQPQPPMQQPSMQQPSMTQSKEGFQSYQNPYNSPSPSSQQAYEFRLGRRNLTDEVLGVMNT
jgi:hypothetical protein